MLPLGAQDQPKDLLAKYISEPITLDGRLNEAVWQQADSTHSFWQFFPTDTVLAEHQTTVRVVYDDEVLYLSIHAEAPSDDYVVSTLQRDYRGSTNDNVSLMFDTFRDGANAFQFGVTPYGVRREVLISGGGASIDGFNNTWDIKWRAESHIYEDHYTVEMAIPFSSLKFPEGSTRWRFQVYRFNLQTNEQSTWARVPQNQLLINLAFMGDLIFEKPLGQSRRLLAFIPYVNALAQHDFEADVPERRLGFGGDAKVAIGSGMNLDITANPDFSNVQVDDIFTNLTRFEIQLPERRQFFIDNSDLFDSFGSQNGEASPFFSRRIGLARDTAGNLIENRILGGARLSGKLDDDWRLGFLNIQTAHDQANEIPSYNNLMFALQRKVLARSNLGVFLLNRQAFGAPAFLDSADRYNRVAGAEFNLASADNVWSGKFYLHKSFQPGDYTGNFSGQAALVYNTRFYNAVVDLVYVDQDFRSDLGFIPRTDIIRSRFQVGRTFYPQRGFVNTHALRATTSVFWRPNFDYQMTDQDLQFFYEMEFKDRSSVNVRYQNQYIYLTEGFDPTRTEGGIPLPGLAGYRFSSVRTRYQSNRTKLLTFNGNLTVGEFFNGQRLSAGGELAFRFQPYAQVGLEVNYDQLRMPEPHPSADLWLFTTRLDLTFTKQIFWSTLLQYSNQRNNLGINSRLQWRFAPLSDLFLVYNDNYYADRFSPRFRSINLRVSYWLQV